METNYVLCITFYHTVVKMSRYAEADFSVFRLKNAFSDGYNIRFFHKKQHQPFAVIEINYERIINPPRYLFCFFFLHRQLSFRKKFGGSGIDLLNKKWYKTIVSSSESVSPETRAYAFFIIFRNGV